MKASLENVTSKDLKKAKKKVTKPRDIRSVFRERLASLAAEGGVSKVRKPWMSTKAFCILDTPEALQSWADDVIANAPRFEFYGHTSPVVAVDTETLGLDTRLFVRLRRLPDGSYKQFYEVKTDVAGICLSADGIKGVYIPLNHEFQDIGLGIAAKVLDRAACDGTLQRLFDQCHLVFYNGKFDREVMRLTLGIVFRPYPFFEDVQVLAYINDPKADLEDKSFYTGDAGGLKAVSKNILGIEQIELEDIARVRAETCPLTGTAFCQCSAEQKKERKHGLKFHYVPFSWVPVALALWYAASDAICTWMLWEKMHALARTRRTVHRIDHELVDTIAWIERQRFIIDTERHARTVRGHQKKIAGLEKRLYDLGIAAGYPEPHTDEGEVFEKDRFNPGSNKQLQKLFFEVKGWKPTRRTPTGQASCDAEAIGDLQKLYPDDEFLSVLSQFNDYKALHPADLRFDPADGTARIYLKQNVVAGGRLSSAGGEFEKDGGFGLNSQAVKKVEPHLMWKVRGNVLKPDEIPEDQIEEHAEEDLHPSCFREVGEDGGTMRKKAPGIVHNHIGQYMGYAICLVPGCKTCAEKFGVLIEDAKMDANEVVNLRALFCSPPGWTFFTIDYGNIEMRAAANCSGEPEFIKEFLEGKGDFHSLTASKVFPEFNDPRTPKEVRKKLRDLAKIINFALLYGGTEYAIYENMRKQDPNITKERAKEMVENYWKGVPVFFAFCQQKQAMARDQLLCTTVTGRVINFQSAMDALHLHVPNEEERKNYWKYRDLMRKAEELKVAGDSAWSEYFNLASSMWKNLDTGVRNCMDYNKFMGKIQRVSVNAPLQGLAGDFMRMSLNKIHTWVESDPPVQSVIMLHVSVHDEIDFSVKDEYVPFVVPRVTRIMKLRKLHERLKWPVPIECDAEYGISWDVEHHVTGDDDHVPVAWTKIKAIANYLPDGWEAGTVRNLIKAIASGDERRVARADAFLKENLHKRAYAAAWHCFWRKDGQQKARQSDPKAVRAALLVALQLDEFWRLDGVPDDEGDGMETLEQYEARNGLGLADRNPAALSFGPLGSLPLDAEVQRPVPEMLGAFFIPPPPGMSESSACDAGHALETPQMALPLVPSVPTIPEPAADAAGSPSAAPEPIPISPPPGTKVFELGDLRGGRDRQLSIIIGKGPNPMWVRLLNGEEFCIHAMLDHIPDKFLKKKE